MKKTQEKIQQLELQILENHVTKEKELLITEMKKIGIEKLPYSYSALKQFIDPETMSFHYNKHYKGYVDKLNDALSKKKYGDLDLEKIIKTIGRFDKTIRNNAGGAFNHALFWNMLTPEPKKLTGELYKKITKQWGTFTNFKKEFEKVAKERFGSGWVWLVLTKRNKLKIVSTPNQDNPLMNVVEDGGYPLLGLDLWEHAYYLKYRNKRDEYIKNFWLCVNWDFVNKLYSMRMEKKLNETENLRTVLSEGKSERCSREETESIRMVFNINPRVKDIFKVSINKILREVFPDNYFNVNEFAKGEMAGVYNLEGEGRSVINKLNTNYSCFCVLLNDVNTVLDKANQPKIQMVGLTPAEQVNEVKKLVNILDKYKFRIFNRESATFQNLMRILTQTDSWGQKREDVTVDILKKKFGKDNVRAIGKLGSREDMIGGIDCEIDVAGTTHTSQIKPFTALKKIDGFIHVFGSANVKKYSTDWLIFTKNNKDVVVFRNKNTKIIDGQYVFPEKDLIYSLN